ncbi:MAG: phenylalanine--tRNA ligase subunit alpha [Candidatus Liptonbacteria bacterium]|nr:phenylalanine--tRNA ligase subunit alpha [Candidatus Liptonbacteria bacterium]
MKIDGESVRKSALEEIKKASIPQEFETIRIKYLGRKGALAALFGSLKDFTLEERRTVGPKLQALKNELEELVNKKQETRDKRQGVSDIDLSAPGKRVERGHLHPLTLVEREIRKIFLGMNFSIIEGPEVESEYYNFDVLNVPANHPAREMWDTFWLKPRPEKSEFHPNDPNKTYKLANVSTHKLLLRTHTSPMQVRYMETHKPPFQILVPGRVFRYEATDASHETNFYQLEGLMVGKNITLANFKFVVEEFFKKFFAGQKIEFRYRPSYFPFVEPGLEVIVKLEGKWLEMMGAGMVHPNVFEHAGYNPRDWQGFAFGMGLDRLAMVKHKIPDIRLFYSGDLRFIRQF